MVAWDPSRPVPIDLNTPTMKLNRLLPPLLGIALAFALNAASTSPDWSQWRGPQRDGQFAGPAWPDSLSTNQLRQIWRVELGPSYSGPVTAGSRVFTTETRDKKFEVVTAWDRETGRPLWKAEWPGAMSVPFFAKSNGDWIRSTPTSDGESLFVAGMRDVLVCLDVSTGQERWRKDFVSELKTPKPRLRLCVFTISG